jgi:hypothetical protein
VLEPKPATPSYWKALLFTSILGLPILYWMSHTFTRAAPIVWYIATPIAIGIVAYGVHARTLNDWRASDQMNYEAFNRKTSVTRNLRVKRK